MLRCRQLLTRRAADSARAVEVLSLRQEQVRLLGRVALLALAKYIFVFEACRLTVAPGTPQEHYIAKVVGGRARPGPGGSGGPDGGAVARATRRT